MEPLTDLPALQAILDALAPRGLVKHLSPPGQKRGVYVAHGLYPADEFEKVRAAFSNRPAAEDEAPARLSTARVDLAAAPSRRHGPPRSPRSGLRSSNCGRISTSLPTKCATSSPRSEFDRMSISSLEPEDAPLDPALPSAPALTAVREGAHDGASAAGIAAGEIEIAQPVAEPPRDGWALIALVPYDGQEPPATVSDELAMGVWCAVSALWHPSLLARAAGLPRIESVDSPSPPGHARSG